MVIKMNWLVPVSTCIGFAGMLLLLICYQFEDFRKVLLAKFSADCLWAVHYALIGGFSGLTVNVICAVREIVYMFDQNKKRRNIWLIFFMIAGWIISYFRWNGIVSILPTIVFTAGAYSFWQRDVRVTRAFAIFNACLMFTYDIFVSSYIGMLSESLTIVTVIIAIVKNSRKAHC